MTINELKDQIEVHLMLNNVEVGGEEYIPHIASLAYEGNYTQILYDYGLNVLLIVLKALEHNEQYEECAELVQTIKNISKVEGNNLPTKYKDNE